MRFLLEIRAKQELRYQKTNELYEVTRQCVRISFSKLAKNQKYLQFLTKFQDKKLISAINFTLKKEEKQ